MDLEQIFQNAGSMDAQNITLFLLSLIAQFGSTKSTKNTISTNKENEQDPDLLLALNITDMLMKYNKYDPTFWDIIASNLEEEEIRRKEEANKRLSPTTSNVLISVYVMPFYFIIDFFLIFKTKILDQFFS